MYHTPGMSHGGMGRYILLLCYTDVVIQLLTILMSHRESYSRVNVIRDKFYMRCGYSGCRSLYVSGMVMVTLISKFLETYCIIIHPMSIL